MNRSFRQPLRTILLSLLLVLTLTPLAACSDDESLDDLLASGEAAQVERGTGTLDLVRTTPAGKQPKDVEEDTWTIFVYLCGSDLETENGAATTDLGEMVGASGSDRVSFVVETGGAKKWQGNVKSGRMQRFVIQDGSIMEVDSSKTSNMGESSTLANFLQWGLENYPADHMGLILWDHGGGSVSGVCFDERSDYDALTLPELSNALADVNNKLWEKFEFVGFDACLMGTLECANTLVPYANYMVASAETEPACGWEYSSIMEYLAKHPSADGAALGKDLCNEYFNSLESKEAAWATLSVVDLNKIDPLIQDFYHFSQEMYEAGSNQSTLAAMSRSIKGAENYGSNNWLSGYTNMVDLEGIVDACAGVTPSAQDVKDSLNDAVAYQVRGKYHTDSCGLSTYYPLKVEDADELAGFTKVAVNPSYLSYVDRLAHGATYDGGEEYEDYSDDDWFEGGFWAWLFSDDELSDDDEQEYEDEAEQYWSYVDEHSDESQLISFDEEPQLDEDGTYWFRLDKEGLENAAVVSGLVYVLSEDEEDWIALGETYDVNGDWETGEFSDGFDGKWLSLPDGQNLCLYVEGCDEDRILYTSPIKLNGEECYLRLRQNIHSGKVTVEGTWGGIDEYGASDRGTTPLKKGDVIVPLYDAFTENDEESLTYEGEEYTVRKGELKVGYDYLPAATYAYSFCIEDVFGDYMICDPVEFEVADDGKVYFAE